VRSISMSVMKVGLSPPVQYPHASRAVGDDGIDPAVTLEDALRSYIFISTTGRDSYHICLCKCDTLRWFDTIYEPSSRLAHLHIKTTHPFGWVVLMWRWGVSNPRPSDVCKWVYAI